LRRADGLSGRAIGVEKVEKNEIGKVLRWIGIRLSLDPAANTPGAIGKGPCQISTETVKSAMILGEKPPPGFEYIPGNPPSFLDSRALSDQMNHPAGWNIPGLPASPVGSQTEICFLKIKEISFIHESDCIKDFFSNHHAGTGNLAAGMGSGFNGRRDDMGRKKP
jgi:hypothetical protein